MGSGRNVRRIAVRVRPWTLGLVGLLLVATVVTSLVIGRIAEQQDERLLASRTGEVAVFLESSMREIEVAFPYLVGVSELAADPAQGFESAANELIGDTIRGVGTAASSGDSYRTIAVVGDGAPPGATVGRELSALLARAQGAGELVTGVLPADGAVGTRVGFAYAVDGVAAVYFMELVFDPPRVIEQGPGTPFGDIEGAVYVGTDPDPEHLVLTTASALPLTGTVVRDSITVGADEWLVLTSTRAPLVGSLAQQTRWGVLIGGFALALLTGVLVEILNRRRAYALRLVAERTADLDAARRAAEDANRSKSVFLSRMSHELRTPLNAVLGFGQVLEAETLDPGQRDSVAQILKGGRHLLGVITDVLDIARIEAGELSLSPEAVDLRELVQETVELMQPLADGRGIQLLYDRAGTCDHYVLADRQRAKQVLLNLMSNAVKYNRQRGTVSVACRPQTETTTAITVTDTGMGIPAERLGQIFTAFDRLGAQHSDVEGTGIGLAISLRLAEAMGGALHVESTLGAGSVFAFELPIVEGPVERHDRLHAAPARPQPPAREAHRPVVLHIEDNLANLRLIERIFEDHDVRIVAAMQGRLGLELAREHRPALVLLDLHLADMDGELVLHRLRNDPATAHLPVVIVSADATKGTIQRLLTAGATAFVTKPIDIGRLVQLLEDALESHSSRGPNQPQATPPPAERSGRSGSPQHPADLTDPAVP